MNKSVKEAAPRCSLSLTSEIMQSSPTLRAGAGRLTTREHKLAAFVLFLWVIQVGSSLVKWDFSVKVSLRTENSIPTGDFFIFLDKYSKQYTIYFQVNSTVFDKKKTKLRDFGEECRNDKNHTSNVSWNPHLLTPTASTAHVFACGSAWMDEHNISLQKQLA